ncbi:nucleobase:cation symporter [Burkholderia aenigmatica]|uniref:Nucleobase:cation symporter n=1 Tax=Burkholderia aenigmatica TaxID=2015348 RepID=A0A6P2R3L6_9BURK|nr:nucleobase:cation symporter [Burkholderia aenigmatica]
MPAARPSRAKPLSIASTASEKNSGNIVIARVARIAYAIPAAVGGSIAPVVFAMISVMGIQLLASIDLHARANQSGVPAALRFFNPLLLFYLVMPIDGTRTAH